MRRGFTLIELAVVIVIAGILAAIAVPIYSMLTEESKWSEGRHIAATIRKSLDIYYVKNEGWENRAGSVVADGDWDDWHEIVGIEESDLGNMRYFTTDAIELTDVGEDNDSATFTIVIHGSGNNSPNTVAGAPRGRLELTHEGLTDIDTN